MWQKLRKLLILRGRVIRAAIGANLAATTLWGVVAYPTQAFDYTRTTNEYVDGSQVEVIATQSTFFYPVAEPTGTSQGYTAVHRGVDIRAPRGTVVVAIDEGMVIEASQDAWGYGKHVRVAHNGTVSTLYAHLDQIQAEVGDKVQAGEQIGTVGRTGWATGTHLHFEVMDGSQTMNPMNIISDNQNTQNSR